MKNAVWFEIPATDLDRAIKFYEEIFAKTLRRESMGGIELGVFPYEQPNTGGAVVKGPAYQPSGDGTGPVVYVAANGEIDAILARVPAAGGSVALPKTSIEDVGAIAHVIDPEGNRVGLHAV